MILGLAYISICITSPFFLQADKQQSSFKSGVAYPEIKKPNPFFSGPKGEGEWSESVISRLQSTMLDTCYCVPWNFSGTIVSAFYPLAPEEFPVRTIDVILEAPSSYALHKQG